MINVMVTHGKLLLTGGSGMVGQNIQEHPLARGWDILAPTSKELDLTNYDSVETFFKKHKPEIIVHAAGRVGGIQANVAHPVSFLVSNIDIGRNVIMAARHVGVTKLLNLASSCMYPRNAPNPLSEELVLKGELEPTNEGYALAKVFATRLCQYIRSEDSSYLFKTLIPCNLYGRYDKFSLENAHLIPSIIYKIHMAKKEGRDKVEIWGDGLSRREFMYAGDMADIIFRCLERFDELPTLMNVGIGHDYTINEYYQSVAQVIGWAGEFFHDLTKPVGMKQKLVDVSKQMVWGWEPTTTLHEGIEKTYEFYTRNVKYEF